jgi:hypothetical protein
MYGADFALFIGASKTHPQLMGSKETEKNTGSSVGSIISVGSSAHIEAKRKVCHACKVL